MGFKIKLPICKKWREAHHRARPRPEHWLPLFDWRVAPLGARLTALFVVRDTPGEPARFGTVLHLGG
eukprot:6138382-Alexandrium_andersonii.AAC.1